MSPNRSLFSQRLTWRHVVLRLAFWSALFALLFMVVARPISGGPLDFMSLNGKFVYGAMYGCLALLGLLGRIKSLHVLSILLAHGALVEMLESLVLHRNADWQDLAADCIGVLAVLAAACVVKRHHYYS